MPAVSLEPLPLTSEEIDDVLFPARFGELEELRDVLNALAAKYGVKDSETQVRQRIVLSAQQEKNTPFHYAAANGHADIVDLLAPYSPAQVLIAQNAAGNTPMHWAALNGHLAVVKKLVQLIEAADAAHQIERLDLQPHPSEGQSTTDEGERDPDAPAPPAWDIRNHAGRGPMTEAEMNGKQEVVQFLLERSIVGANQQGVQDDLPEGAAAPEEDDDVPDQDTEQGIPPAPKPDEKASTSEPKA